MTAERSYFDWNATAPLRPQAQAAMVAALQQPGNASSVHAEGRTARSRIEEARAQLAKLVAAEPTNVIFTSGATEANMLALTPALDLSGRNTPRDRLFVSAVEHPSVRGGGRFAPENVEVLPVDGEGLVDVRALKRALAPAERPLVSVMLANNETGVIQPIAEIAGIVHELGGLLHVDGVQAAGRVDCDFRALGADMLSLSSHKLGGPHGAGALVLRDGLHIGQPLISGGGQERGRRAGTENVAAIAGFGAAAAVARAGREAEAARIAALRDRVEAGIRAVTPQAVIFGAGVARLPNTTLVAVPGIKAETALIAFDLAGIALSAGSACSSGKVQDSYVLKSMGVEPRLAYGALRISLGWETCESDVEKLLNAWNAVVSSLLKRQPNPGLAA